MLERDSPELWSPGLQYIKPIYKYVTIKNGLESYFCYSFFFFLY